MDYLNHFFTPYLRVLKGAEFSIAQNLVGLGIESNGNEQLYALLFSGLKIYSLALIVLIIVAFYVLGRMKAVLIVLFIFALPGILELFGVFPFINYVPRVFVVSGAGAVGSTTGLFPVIILGALTGWSVLVILADVFNYQERFRHYYDHLWYTMAVLAAYFFVADLNARSEAAELRQAEISVRQISTYLLDQVREYEHQCRETAELGEASCKWASAVQELLINYAMTGVLHPGEYYDHEESDNMWGPKKSAEIYSASSGKYRGTLPKLSPQEILSIRREIIAYNDSRCPHKITEMGQGAQLIDLPKSGICQQTPWVACQTFADSVEDETLRDQIEFQREYRVALASECVVPTLIRYRKEQERLSKVVYENRKDRHYRWLFFIGFAVLVGGKVANSTCRAIRIDERQRHERRRLRQAVRSTIRAVVNLGGAVSGYLAHVFRRVSSSTSKR